MRPVPLVLAHPAKDAEVLAGRGDVDKVRAVVPHERGDGPDAGQPHVVKDHEAAGGAQPCGQGKVGQGVVETVVAVDEDQVAPLSCPLQVDEGAVPNQYGTWWYGRDGWCPGKEVPMQVLDITDQVVLGSLNTFDYEGYHDGAAHPGNDANIVMNSWLVIER